MLTFKEIDEKIGTLKREHKNQLDISKFLLLRAEIKIENLKNRQSAGMKDEIFQKEVLEIKNTLTEALHSALLARTKICLALALLEKSKMSLDASQKRIDDILDKNKTVKQIKQEHQVKKHSDAITDFLKIKVISISCTVYEVIRKAMASYYFDKIGDSLLERTKNPDNFNLSEFKILVESYNVHVYIPIEVERLINGKRSHYNSNEEETKED